MPPPNLKDLHLLDGTVTPIAGAALQQNTTISPALDKMLQINLRPLEQNQIISVCEALFLCRFPSGMTLAKR